MHFIDQYITPTPITSIAIFYLCHYSKLPVEVNFTTNHFTITNPINPINSIYFISIFIIIRY